MTFIPEKPRLPLPPPLRGLEPNTFTHHSVAVRLREIARRVLAENDFTAQAEAHIASLIREIPFGAVRALHDAEAPDGSAWAHYTAPHVGQNWLEVPWFFAEAYFYRRLLEATGYFLPEAGHHVDPFALQKRRGLETTRDATRALCARVDAGLADPATYADAVVLLLMADLWGNQADLSLWPAGDAGQPNHVGLEQQRVHLLVDDAGGVASVLADRAGRAARVDFLVDNAGFEFVGDLCLADFLLRSGMAATVVLHLKAHPTFVSDAMVKDFYETVAFLAEDSAAAAQALAVRLQEYVRQGRLLLREDFFFTSPLPYWEMPATLRAALAPADLVVSKGDANYRRLLGDRHWPFTAPMADIVNYFPASVVALRTLKSEIVAGLKPGHPAALAARDPDWLINGRWGVIQFVKASKQDT